MAGHARSFHIGDSITYVYRGEQLSVFGTLGPNGGAASVIEPDFSPVPIDFYAPVRKRHHLIFTSPPNAPGIHTLSIVVTSPRSALRSRGYVNIDGVAVSGRTP